MIADFVSLGPTGNVLRNGVRPVELDGPREIGLRRIYLRLAGQFRRSALCRVVSSNLSSLKAKIVRVGSRSDGSQIVNGAKHDQRDNYRDYQNRSRHAGLLRSAIALVTLFLCATSFAQTVNVTLAWDQNLEPDVAEYRLNIGTAHGVYGQPIFVRGTQQTVALTKGVLHYATVQAVNTSGLASLPSEELVFQVFNVGEGVVPSAPTNLRKIGAASISIETSEDLQIWSVLHSELVSLTNPNQFFRLVLTAP